MASNVNQHNQLLQLFAAYAKRLDKLYDDFVNRLIASLPYSEDEVWERLAVDPLFRFDQFPEFKARLDGIFSDFVGRQVACCKAGITAGVALAYAQDAINIGKYSVLRDKAARTARDAAAASFIANRMSRKEGLSLSDRVWNYSQLGKAEVEMGISNVLEDGLKAGASAEELGRKVRQYLNNPTMMYRRYWVTVADHAGNKRKVARWYRRHIDGKTGKVTFSDEPLEKVGMGVCRSARKNAHRLVRTEINMSYHKANASRWANEPFVYGIRVWRSPQHPESDICDELEGCYPKDFVFSGWHPACLCASAPLTLYGEEKRDFYRRLMNGEDMSNFHSKHEITEANMNPNWKRYIESQHENIINAAKRGKLAFHLQDNKKYWLSMFNAAERRQMGLSTQKKSVTEIAAARHAARTEEQAKDIADRWHAHKRVDALIRQAQPLVADLKEYPLVGNWRVLQDAIDNRSEQSLKTLLADKLMPKKLAYEKLITPKELKWSELVKNFTTEETATWVQNQMTKIVREARKEKSISAALKSLSEKGTERIYNGLVDAEKKACDMLLDREKRRMQDYFRLNNAKDKINLGLDYIKKNIGAIGGNAHIPTVNLNGYYLGDAIYMEGEARSVGNMVRNLETIVDNSSYVSATKSPIIHQLYDGIKYALQKYGLAVNVDDEIAKLESNISRLKKLADKRAKDKAKKEAEKSASAKLAKIGSIKDIEKSFTTATKAIKKTSDEKAYYTKMCNEIEKNLTYRQGEKMPKSLQRAEDKLMVAIDIGYSDSIIERYFEVFKHKAAVLEAYDRQFQNGMRTRLGLLTERLSKQGITYREVQTLGDLTEEQIIKRICGGDLTKGSCSSLALTYAGNKGGLDVLDFRDGKSRLFFSNRRNISDIIRGCNGTIVSEYDDFVAAKKLFTKVEEGKEYYFCIGRHAAIIRKGENGMEFLELQSSTSNGFKPLNKAKLKSRFGCESAYKLSDGSQYTINSYIIEISKLNRDRNFRNVLGYINTDAKKQHKGAHGTIK